MKKIIIDLDNTITIENPNHDYPNKRVNLDVKNKIIEYKNNGFTICIHTARNMKTYNNNVSKINAFTLPTIIDWLKKNEIPYDEIFVGKPWCGKGGFYVDDKAIRPNEFIQLSNKDIDKLINE
tara:strand:+ start:185 stop:553 length:369 start_codon:yes stop_codon:yes gene_type:complete